MRKLIQIMIVTILAALVALSAYRIYVKRPKCNVIATVNKEPVYVDDFKRSVEINARRNPAYKLTREAVNDEVNILIDKKLLIQEAKARKLDSSGHFRDTIKNFWEQTLIRELMEFEGKKAALNIEVSDAEVKDLYDKLAHRKTFQLVKSPDKIFITTLMSTKPASIKWQKTIGPMGYSDISSKFMLDVFKLKKADMKVFKNDDEYYLFYVSGDEKVTLPLFEEMRSGLKNRLLEEKKQEKFQVWLNDIRSKASIKVNKEVLGKLNDTH
ncbi:MAG: hypothetical protein HQL28_06880 [Candidatus Omnitrophica bacterium]|nr:hypothetical protein [Candidatus Omnitrophota bacterium]